MYYLRHTIYTNLDVTYLDFLNVDYHRLLVKTTMKLRGKSPSLIKLF